jgi:3-oxoacyl-[acyl-carrier-protein] synthase III
VTACATREPVSITGLGRYVPERVLENAGLAAHVDTSDTWIRLGLELGADGSGDSPLMFPGGGSRTFSSARRFLEMNGREMYRFATRAMVSSAEALLRACGKTIAEVDVDVRHQANIRIIEHAVGRLGSRGRRWSSTSSGRGTPHRARFRSLWATRPPRAVFNLEN